MAAFYKPYRQLVDLGMVYIRVNPLDGEKLGFELASCLVVASLACSPGPAQPGRIQAPANAPPSVASPTLPEPATNARCVVRGQVSRRDVVWKLRTRLDAVPTMQVEEGIVTAALRAGERRYHPNALVEVENSSMMIRALVATEDLKVVVTKAYESLPGHFPDGFTHRPVLEVEGSEAWVEVDLEGATGTVSTLDCKTLGLVGTELGAEGSLPPAQGKVVVKKGVSVKTPDAFRSIDGLWTPSGVSSPEGILGELRGDDTDPLARLVSFQTCGGMVVGFVPKSALLGPPKVGFGSNARCPNTGASVFTTRGELERLVKCPREIPVFLRSATLEDPVGFLRAGGRFRVDGKEARGTKLITVETPPAVPLEGFSFSVRGEDLDACAPA